MGVYGDYFSKRDVKTFIFNKFTLGNLPIVPAHSGGTEKVGPKAEQLILNEKQSSSHTFEIKDPKHVRL